MCCCSKFCMLPSAVCAIVERPNPKVKDQPLPTVEQPNFHLVIFCWIQAIRPPWLCSRDMMRSIVLREESCYFACFSRQSIDFEIFTRNSIVLERKSHWHFRFLIQRQWTGLHLATEEMWSVAVKKSCCARPILVEPCGFRYTRYLQDTDCKFGLFYRGEGLLLNGRHFWPSAAALFWQTQEIQNGEENIDFSPFDHPFDRHEISYEYALH